MRRHDHKVGLARLRQSRRAALLAGACAVSLPLIAKAQSTYTVTQTTDNGTGVSGSLSWAIDQANANPGSTIDISLGSGGGSGGDTILLQASLPQITAAVTINGNDTTIDGNNAYRIFFVNDSSSSSPDVTIQSLSLTSGLAQGGSGGTGGGGGGLGAGAGLFVGAGNVSLENVSLNGNTAIGGNGGAAISGSPTSGGGGGGIGGSGGSGASGAPPVGLAEGSPAGGGGGGGYSTSGADGTATFEGGPSGGGGNGGGYSGGEGGSGGPPNTPGDAGKPNGGGGGGGPGAESGGAGGDYGGGGGAGVAASKASGSGGNGGFGGGGGGGGGAGGFGGGGGGGAGGDDAGAGGDDAGAGGRGTGGGGAALGANVFVRQGATISFSNVSIGDGTLVAGIGGGSGASSGAAAGGSLFLMGGNTTFSVSANATSAITDSIAESSPSSITVSGGTGGGTLALQGDNSYSGGTTVTGGAALSVSADNNLGAATAGLTLEAGGILSASSFTSARGITLGSGGGVVDVPSGTMLLSGVISGAGGLTKTSAGMLELSNANTYSGDTNVDAGTLSITGGSTGDPNADLTIDGLPGTAADIQGNADGTGASLAFQGLYAGYNSNGAFTQNGGTLTGYAIAVGYNAASTGTFTLESGQINTSVITLGAEQGTGVFTQTGGLVTNAGSVYLAYNAGGTGTYNLNGGTLNTGSIQGNAGAGTFNFNGGTLQANASGELISGLATANVQAGGAIIDTNGFNVSIASSLLHDASGADGGLTKTGAGTLTLTQPSTYTGGTTINGGTLSIDSDDELGPGAVTVGSGASLQLTGNISTSRTFNLNFSTLSPAAGGYINYLGATVNGGYLGGGSHVFSNGTMLNATTLLAGVNATQTDGGTTTFNTATLRGAFAQTYGTLNFNDGLITSSGSMTIADEINTSGVESDGTLTIGGFTSLTITVEEDGHSVLKEIGFEGTVNNSTTDLTLGGGSQTYIGTVQNSSGVINLASGTAVDVNGGLLDNNGAVTGGPVNVNYGGEAMGAGSYDSVVVNRGGTFHPGNSPGTATVTNYTFGPGSSFEFDIDNATGTHGTNWSLLDASGAVNITATSGQYDQATIDIDSLLANDSGGSVPNFDPTQSYTWDFVDGGAIDGFSPDDFSIDTSNLTNPLDGGSFSVVQVGDNLDLQFTPATVPEPAPFGVALAGAAGLLARRRRVRVAAADRR